MLPLKHLKNVNATRLRTRRARVSVRTRAQHSYYCIRIRLFHVRESKTEKAEDGREDVAAQMFLVRVKIMQKHSE